MFTLYYSGNVINPARRIRRRRTRRRKTKRSVRIARIRLVIANRNQKGVSAVRKIETGIGIERKKAGERAEMRGIVVEERTRTDLHRGKIRTAVGGKEAGVGLGVSVHKCKQPLGHIGALFRLQIAAATWNICGNHSRLR